MSTVTFPPSDGLKGTFTPPADKSISHRAALLAAMASEPVVVRNYLDAADTNSTLAAVAAVGAIVQHGADEKLIRGTGLRNAHEPPGTIDVGNAGTLMRLLRSPAASVPAGACDPVRGRRDRGYSATGS